MRRGAEAPQTEFVDHPEGSGGRHKLHRLSHVLCGAASFEDMEVFGHAKSDGFEIFLELPHGNPSHDTFNRVFAALDPEQFLACFTRWTQSLRAAVASLTGRFVSPLGLNLNVQTLKLYC